MSLFLVVFALVVSIVIVLRLSFFRRAFVVSFVLA